MVAEDSGAHSQGTMLLMLPRVGLGVVPYFFYAFISSMAVL